MRTGNPLGVAFKAMTLGLFFVAMTLWSLPYVTVLSPSFLKSTLESSGVYDTLAESSAQILTDSDGHGAEDSAVATGLTQPFEQVLTPQRLRTVTEPVIDGLGDWLHGDTPVPHFSIDTGAIRSDLNRAVADHTAERLATLPVCPGATDFSDYNPMTATCRSPREPSESELLGWTDDFTSQIPLLSKNTVSDADVVNDPSDRSWRLIPSTYGWVRITLCVLAGLFVLTTAIVLIAGRKRDRTLRTLGHALLVPAILFLVGGALVAAFSGFFTYDLASADTQMRSDFATETVLPVFQTLIRGVGLWGMLFGAIFAVLATIAYVVSRQLRKRGTQDRITTPGWLPPDQGVTR